MLKEVTGTESFDSRVEKMSTVLNECASKKKQLDTILESIKQRLDQLGQEIEEYREIQHVEKEKKALELALYTRKIQANKVEMDQLRTDKSKLLETRQELINQMEDLKIQNSGHKERYEELRSSIRRIDIRLENLIKLRGEIEFQQQNNENFALQKKEKHTL